MDSRPRYRVPDELRETLLDFTIAYLLERPTSLPAFGLSFFQKLKEEKQRAGGSGGQGQQRPANNQQVSNNAAGPSHPNPAATSAAHAAINNTMKQANDHINEASR